MIYELIFLHSIHWRTSSYLHSHFTISWLGDNLSVKAIKLIRKHKHTRKLFLENNNLHCYNLDHPTYMLLVQTDLLANFSLIRMLTWSLWSHQLTFSCRSKVNSMVNKDMTWDNGVKQIQITGMAFCISLYVPTITLIDQ